MKNFLCWGGGTNDGGYVWLGGGVSKIGVV
jgi:hypothetical protein